MNVLDRDAVTIRDAVTLLTGGAVRDHRGRELDSPRTYSTNRASGPRDGSEWLDDSEQTTTSEEV